MSEVQVRFTSSGIYYDFNEKEDIEKVCAELLHIEGTIGDKPVKIIKDGVEFSVREFMATFPELLLPAEEKRLNVIDERLSQLEIAVAQLIQERAQVTLPTKAKKKPDRGGIDPMRHNGQYSIRNWYRRLKAGNKKLQAITSILEINGLRVADLTENNNSEAITNLIGVIRCVSKLEMLYDLRGKEQFIILAQVLTNYTKIPLLEFIVRGTDYALFESNKKLPPEAVAAEIEKWQSEPELRSFVHQIAREHGVHTGMAMGMLLAGEV